MILLRFTPPESKDGIGRFNKSEPRTYYFQRLGLQWPRDPSKRLIDATTPNKEEARQFNTAEEAREVLVVAGNPRNWELVDA